MPYVTKEIRSHLDEELTTLIDKIRTYPDEENAGILNFLVTSLVAEAMKPHCGWNYKSLHKAYGVFHAAGAEFYRRLVAPYEDKCIEKNSDLPCFCNKP